MIPIYAICGIAYGMVELIRRTIPRDIVGGNVQKLRKMDSLVSNLHRKKQIIDSWFLGTHLL